MALYHFLAQLKNHKTILFSFVMLRNIKCSVAECSAAQCSSRTGISVPNPRKFQHFGPTHTRLNVNFDYS